MNFWKDKQILVTGGAGLLGHRIAEVLVERHAAVTIGDDLSRGEMSNITNLVDNHKVQFRRMSTLDASAVKSLFTISAPSICIHLAARLGGIGYFHKNTASILRDNLISDLNMLDAARDFHLEKIVCLSSSMVFERAQSFPSSEKDLLATPPPLTAYGFSKLAIEYMIRAYHEQYGLHYVLCRPFNVYGKGETAGDYVGYSHVIPDLISKILSGQYPLEILGSGAQTRSYTYIDDLADAILFLAERYENDDFNIGTGIETSVTELAQVIWRLCGRTERFTVKHMPSFEFDVQRRVPDVTKIMSCGWKPRVSLNEGLSRTIRWFKEERV